MARLTVEKTIAHVQDMNVHSDLQKHFHLYNGSQLMLLQDPEQVLSQHST